MNAMTVAPLLARLAAAPDAQWVDASSLEPFRAAPGAGVLLIWSDPVRFPECLDVAVVLPELRRHLSEGDARLRFRIGVVTAGAEDAAARLFGATRRPALVFLRDGAYIDTVSGMLDWDDFVAAATQALQAPPRRAPSVGIAVVGTSASPGCH